MSIKQRIIERVNEAKMTYNISFMSLSLDLIQNEVPKRKMTGVRVTYMHNSSLCSHNLSVRGYNPSREEIAASLVLELLVEWCSLILTEFAVSPEQDILTSCTDSGSDVKKAMEGCITSVFFTRERAPATTPHMSNLDLTETPGVRTRDKRGGGQTMDALAITSNDR